ncbi:MliC family protein [Pseudomonas sp. Y24-6]|uniref:MliC family protein n=1 Tax=Pseudomonas sp. Y24-6 TaxID=2750013 RepID=UPI001CE040EB|nr:MliC family protein [Pseudomonas sp. Y24-6]MCA4963331.1 MliC family protein [Pseudomonas sp. Y24-6]
MIFSYPMLLASAGLTMLVVANQASAQEGPSFKCSAITPGSMEDLICKSPELATRDRDLAAAYNRALKKAGNRANTLKAEQRGWIKGRDECWKSDNKQACIQDAYRQRMVELQAGYGLVPAIGPVTFECARDGTLSATFFQTEPASMMATYKGEQSLMLVEQSASGARYQGRNESFWEHQGEARVTWGYGAKEMTCKKHN